MLQTVTLPNPKPGRSDPSVRADGDKRVKPIDDCRKVDSSASGCARSFSAGGNEDSIRAPKKSRVIKTEMKALASKLSGVMPRSDANDWNSVLEQMVWVERPKTRPMRVERAELLPNPWRESEFQKTGHFPNALLSNGLSPTGIMPTDLPPLTGDVINDELPTLTDAANYSDSDTMTHILTPFTTSEVRTVRMSE